MEKISWRKTQEAVKMTKSGKSAGPDELTIELIKALTSWVSIDCKGCCHVDGGVNECRMTAEK